MIDGYAIERIVLDQLRATADCAVPAVASDFALGSRGVCADLAVLADEFIGFAIRAAEDSIDGLEGELAAYARCFDRVALVVDRVHVPAVRAVGRHGAALWYVTAGGAIAERSAGAANVVGVSAMVDMLPIEDRRRLLRPLVPQGAVYDRGAPPISPAEVRAYFEGVFVRDHGDAAVALWAA